jgi:hypothetical protein
MFKDLNIKVPNNDEVIFIYFYLMMKLYLFGHKYKLFSFGYTNKILKKNYLKNHKVMLKEVTKLFYIYKFFIYVCV